MSGSEFLTTFKMHKDNFLNKNGINESNAKALDLFEKWLSSNGEAPEGEKVRKVDNVFLNISLVQIISIAQNILIKKGVKVICISFGKSIDLKDNYKCIQVFENTNVYYRIGRTSPRKGKYSKQNLLVIELVMDGNKRKVFIPMLKQKEAIEQQLALPIEREMAHLEATGKYRFKLFFKLDELDDGEINVLEVGRILADFIYVTIGYLQELQIV